MRLGPDIENDDVDAVLPPPRERGTAPDDLWHTGGLPRISTQSARFSKLTVGLAGLTLATLAAFGFVALQTASLLGLTPPSAPRYVITKDVPPVPHPAALGFAQRPLLPATPPTRLVAPAPQPSKPRAGIHHRFRKDDDDDRNDDNGRNESRDDKDDD